MVNHPFLSHEHPLRFAHRGSSILWPENTITAFQGAVDLGYRYIETDVQVTRDGKIVMFHDHHLERVTNGRGKVKAWNWQDLRKLDAAFNFKPEAGFPLRNQGIGIPSLEEAMTTFPGVMFNIDLKQPNIEQVMVDFIRQHHFEERVLIASFYDRRLRRFRKKAGNSNSIATSTARLETAAFWACSRLKKSLNLQAQALQVPPRMKGIALVDDKMVRAAHAIGKQIHVWTINESKEMQQLLDLGVDGIITDRPDLLNRVLAQKRMADNLSG